MSLCRQVTHIWFKIHIVNKVKLLLYTNNFDRKDRKNGILLYQSHYDEKIF